MGRGLWSTLVLIWVLCLWALTPAAAAGQEVRETGAPPALAGWVDWVLFDHQDRLCPHTYQNGNERYCLWPGVLKLSVDQSGGGFQYRIRAFAETWASLPGGPGHWPEEVRVDGAPSPVVLRQGRPVVRVTAGDHSITGAWTWDQIPETLAVPPEAGLFELILSGRPVRFPVRDDEDRVWLEKRARTDETDRLTRRTFRLIDDDIPLTVTTRLELEVSGRPREAHLERVMLEGSRPLALDSPLPARLAADGGVQIQVRPGRYTVTLTARRNGPVEELRLPEGYDREIWAFRPRTDLRLVKIKGPAGVDPSRTGLPPAWREYPAYVMNPGQTMRFETARRGDPRPGPDRLRLDRSWWLDFDGGGLTVGDHITGTMSRNWSLGVDPPLELGRVSVDGEDRLIIELPEGRSGVELRHGRLDLNADSRLPTRPKELPAVGWNHDFQEVSARLHLPPGWRLAAAFGVDAAPGTWLDRWTLLDLFLVLITALAVGRLFGTLWGVLALAALALTYHEPGAPRLVWLNVLAAAALLRVLGQGWVRKLVRLWWFVSVISLLVISVPFMLDQVERGLYPQLEQPGPIEWGGPTSVNLAPKADYQQGVEAEAPSAEVQQSVSPRLQEAPKKKLDYYEEKDLLTQDPQALIQTGPGRPTWDGRTMRLIWHGPVDRDHKLRLWLLGPAVNGILAFSRVLLVGFLVFVMIGFNFRRPMRWPVKTAAAALLVGLSFTLSPAAWGEPPSRPDPPSPAYPPAKLLDQLEQRLLKPPECLPRCAAYPRMTVVTEPDRLTLGLEVHAAARTAVPLPDAGDAWRPASVRIDGRPAEGLRRLYEGGLWIIVPSGVHQLVLDGPVAPLPSFQLSLPLKPETASVSGRGWNVTGLGPGGRVDGGLMFTRMGGAESDEPKTSGGQIEAFFRVRRTLILGLTWNVATRVTRLTPADQPALAAVPLLPGESVTSGGLNVENGQVMVHMEPGTTETRFMSNLEIRDQIVLTAPTQAPLVETWVLDASPIWHLDLSGLTVIHHQDDRGRWRPTWRPYPGEQARIEVTRPEPLSGQTFTVDSAELTVTPGRRFEQGRLELSVRASQGGQHRVELPEGAKLERVTINGQSQVLDWSEREVVLPITPGAQAMTIDYRRPSPGGLPLRGPRVDLGGAAANARIVFDMPPRQWVLWTGGPRLGPAVLFWPYLVVVVLFAWFLGRSALTPLTTRQWILLGLGLTQVRPILALVVVFWLLALSWRRRADLPDHWLKYDLIQVGLAGLTAAALIALYVAVERGLLGLPDMQIGGGGSSDGWLVWTADHVQGVLPRPFVLSVPKLVFHSLMLAWALWLAFSLLKWLKWGFESFAEGGLWKKPVFRRKTKKQPPRDGEFQME